MSTGLSCERRVIASARRLSPVAFLYSVRFETASLNWPACRCACVSAESVLINNRAWVVLAVLPDQSSNRMVNCVMIPRDKRLFPANG